MTSSSLEDIVRSRYDVCSKLFAPTRLSTYRFRTKR